jgi:hypothetical protein
MKLVVGFALLGAGIALSVLAAQDQTTRVRGAIVSLEGNTLTVHRHSGDTVTIALAADARVSAVRSIALADITTGSFIGTAAKRAPNGHLIAQEVVVFPEAERGTGEGHYGWDLGPNSTMTNANVDAVVEGTQGRDLHLSFKGGKNVVTVPPTVPVVKFVPASRADLLPGKQVFVIAHGDDSATHFTSERIVVEKDGVKPPM